MRVANVIEEGKLGGPQIRIVRVAQALSDSVDTLVVMPESNSVRFRALCEEHGIRYYILPLSRLTKQLSVVFTYLLFSPYEIIRLAVFLRRQKFDLVHASGGSWQYKAVIAARLAGIPSVWHLNDTWAPGWVFVCFGFLQRFASGFIFASNRTHSYYKTKVKSPRPYEIIPSIVDLEEFDPRLGYENDEALLNLADSPVIGTIANVNPVKGLEVLLRAIARLKRQGYNPYVLIVGEVSKRQQQYHRRLQSLAVELGLDRVLFTGPRADVRPVLFGLDVYVCSSVAESSPVAVWEAMAMGRAIVSTDVGDVAEHIVDGESGFIVAVDDDETMADRIHGLLCDSRLRIKMSCKAREAASAFGPEVIAARTQAIYSRVIGNGKTVASR